MAAVVRISFNFPGVGLFEKYNEYALGIEIRTCSFRNFMN